MISVHLHATPTDLTQTSKMQQKTASARFGSGVQSLGVPNISFGRQGIGNHTRKQHITSYLACGMQQASSQMKHFCKRTAGSSTHGARTHRQ